MRLLKQARNASNVKKNALIIGIDSTIGGALEKNLLASDWDVYGTTRRKESVTDRISYLDLAKLNAFRYTVPVDAVFLCAGVTKLANCRREPDYAKRINQDAPVRLADYFLNQSIPVIFLSTSAVFNGEKAAYQINDPTSATTLYGKYKAQAEKKMIALSDGIAIVRLTKILTPDYPLIIQWLQAWAKKEVVEPFYDLKLCPISIHTVTHCLKQIVEKKLSGIIHLSGEQDISYHALAERLAYNMGVGLQFIRPKSALTSLVKKEDAPLYTSLDMFESNKKLMIPDTSLDTILTHLYGHQLESFSQ